MGVRVISPGNPAVRRGVNPAWYLVLLCLALGLSGRLGATDGGAKEIRIGILAYNGHSQTRQRWQPTADYLTQQVKPHGFTILPLTHEDFIHAINKGQLDFILTNPGHYINLEVDFGATRIATFKSRYRDATMTQFASVIFTRSDSDLARIEDLKGRSMAAVGEQAFGGFQLAYSELLQRDIDAFDDMRMMWLGFPQTDIVRAVLAGNADAGTVRSGILEKMADAGEIELSGIRILGARSHDAFPLLHSTPLYPEWPIASLPTTAPGLSKQVALALLQMNQDALPAIASGGAGWTIPLGYLKVHELFRSLQIRPYPPVPLELKEFWQLYRHWVLVLGFLFVFCIVTIIFTLGINRRLKDSEQSLAQHGDRLEATIEQRTAELNKINQALRQDIESRVQSETTLHEGCEALQSLNRLSNRHDLSHEQRMQSIIDLACQYLGEEIAIFSVYEAGEFNPYADSSNEEESLSPPLFEQQARRAVDEAGVVRVENEAGWQSYAACSFHISRHRSGLLELVSRQHHEIESYQGKKTLQTELGVQLLQLFTQWLINELKLDESEINASKHCQASRSRFLQITGRELEVLQLVSDGESNKSIARMLNISTKTVELHRSNLLRKTNSGSSVHLIKLATQSRLVD